MLTVFSDGQRTPSLANSHPDRFTPISGDVLKLMLRDAQDTTGAAVAILGKIPETQVTKIVATKDKRLDNSDIADSPAKTGRQR